MNFTIYNDSIVNSKIAQDLQKIKKVLLNELEDNIVAILLTGGFGRGEGGVLIDSGKVRVVNDYDLHVFVRKRVNEYRIKDISKCLAKMLNVDHIDIIVQPIYTLKLLKNTQYGYDLKYGSYLIYGNREILKKLPDFKYLPPKEVEKLLFTRVWCFLGPIKRPFPNTNLTPQEKFFLLNQLSKALLAVEESILMYYRDYHVSYIEKLKRVRKYCSNEKLLEYFKWATAFKIKPIYQINVNHDELYFEVKELFFNSMLKILKECYNKDFRSWIDYLEWYSNRWDVLFQIFLRLLWCENFSYSRFTIMRVIKPAQVALAAAFNPNDIDSVLTNYAEKLLLKVGSFRFSNNLVDKWWRLRAVSLKLQETCEG